MALSIVLACGGRDYSHTNHLFTVLDRIKEERGIHALVHGDAEGADRRAGLWCRYRGVPEIKVPAQWDFYHKSAGPIRNGWMVDYIRPTLVVAFPGGSGTADMVKKAYAAGIEVIKELQ